MIYTDIHTLDIYTHTIYTHTHNIYAYTHISYFSEAKANAEIIPMDVAAEDEHGNPLLLHLAQVLPKP